MLVTSRTHVKFLCKENLTSCFVFVFFHCNTKHLSFALLTLPLCSFPPCQRDQACFQTLHLVWFNTNCSHTLILVLSVFPTGTSFPGCLLLSPFPFMPCTLLRPALPAAFYFNPYCYVFSALQYIECCVNHATQKNKWWNSFATIIINLKLIFFLINYINLLLDP